MLKAILVTATSTKTNKEYQYVSLMLGDYELKRVFLENAELKLIELMNR